MDFDALARALMVQISAEKAEHDRLRLQVSFMLKDRERSLRLGPLAAEEWESKFGGELKALCREENQRDDRVRRFNQIRWHMDAVARYAGSVSNIGLNRTLENIAENISLGRWAGNNRPLDNILENISLERA